MGRRNVGEDRDGSGTHGDVRDGSGDPTGGSGRGRRTRGKVRDDLLDPRGGLGRVVGPSGRSETGRGTLREVWDESLDS